VYVVGYTIRGRARENKAGASAPPARRHRHTRLSRIDPEAVRFNSIALLGGQGQGLGGRYVTVAGQFGLLRWWRGASAVHHQAAALYPALGGARSRGRTGVPNCLPPGSQSASAPLRRGELERTLIRQGARQPLGSRGGTLRLPRRLLRPNAKVQPRAARTQPSPGAAARRRMSAATQR
jgi:hypothetical protein